MKQGISTATSKIKNLTYTQPYYTTVNNNPPHIVTIQLGETMQNSKTATYTTLTILLIIICLTPLVSAATTSTFTIAASTKQILLDLPSGTIFNSTINTSATIRVWASDKNGSLVANSGLIDNNAQLNFVAPNDGIYTFNFENNLGNSASVTFTYQTNPDVTGDNSSILPITYLPIFIAITIVGIFLIFYLTRKNHKNSKQEAV